VPDVNDERWAAARTELDQLLRTCLGITLERVEQLIENTEMLARMSAQVNEMHATLEQFQPVLRMFAPNGGASDVQRAGVLKTMRKAARGA
jgi:hypothetical protein